MGDGAMMDGIMNMMGGGMSGGMIFMGLVWLVLAGLLITALVLAVRALIRNSSSHEGDQREQARSILRERFARGEIDENEYHARRQALESKREPT